MNSKLMILAVGVAVLAGCRTAEITPDESWSDYGSYYASNGKMAKPVADGTVVDFRMVKSAEAEGNVEQMKKQGKIVLGTFVINDGTDITYNAVQALAKKLNATGVIWVSEMDSSRTTSMPNGDPAIPGIDYTKAIHMTQQHPEDSFADQTMRKHTIYMLGCE